MVEHHTPTTAQEIRFWATRYVTAGLSIVPVAPDGSKVPAWQLLPQVWDEAQQRCKHSWKVFQQRLPTQAEIDAWYADLAWGVPCGIRHRPVCA